MYVVTSSAGAAGFIVLRFDVDLPFGSVGLLFLAIFGLGQRPENQGLSAKVPILLVHSRAVS